MRPDVGTIDIGLPRMDQIARRIGDEPHGNAGCALIGAAENPGL